MSNVKQVIIVRKDLNMRKGKIAAQSSHASMKVLLDEMYNYDQYVGEKDLTLHVDKEMSIWLKEGFTKIVLGVESEEELEAVYQKARSAGLRCALIVDAGKTEFHGVPTKTVVAIGPNYSENIDLITRHLSLI